MFTSSFPSLRSLERDPLGWQDVLGALRRSSLMEQLAEQETLSMHRLVQAVVRAGMKRAEQRAWAERVVRLANATFPQVEYATLGRCQQLLPHALVCADHLAAWGITVPEAAWLLSQAESSLQDRAPYPEAEPLLQRARAIDEQALGPDHPTAAIGLENLAGLLHQMSKPEQARPLAERAHAIRARRGQSS